MYVPDNEVIKVYVNYRYSGEVTNLSSAPSTAYCYGHTVNKRNVQSQLIEVDCTDIVGNFAFNLYTTDLTTGDKITSETKGYGDYAASHMSDDPKGYMSAITHFTGEDSPITKSDLQTAFSGMGITLGDDVEFMVLGCEDANGPESGRDFNDVVFLLVLHRAGIVECYLGV